MISADVENYLEEVGLPAGSELTQLLAKKTAQYLPGSVLKFCRIADGQSSVLLLDVLIQSRELGERAEIIVPQHHEVPNNPTERL